MPETVLVIDPITDEEETADHCCVVAGTHTSCVEDRRIIRALYGSPSAKAYGDGSYTVSAEDYVKALEAAHA